MTLTRRRFLQVSSGAALSVALGSCSAGREGSPAGTVRIAGGTFGFPSPFAYIAGPGYVQMSLLYDTLLWKDGSGQLLPWLARRYERSPDGLHYTFFLRAGTRWHDGRPLTAQDVAFTFDYFARQSLGPLLVAQPFGVAGASVRAPDVVEVHLQLPAVTFLESVAAAVPIIPQHVWEGIEDPPRAQDLGVLVGSGPYRLTSFSRAEGLLAYTASESYFLGAPAVRRLEIRSVDDELNALRTGDIDAADTPVEGVRPELLEVFRRDDRFGIIENTGSFTFPLIFNSGRGGALADPVFRRACATALDRTELVERLLGGNGQPGNPGFLPRDHAFHVAVEQYAYDLAGADRLLDEAGYARLADGGVRSGPDGRPLRFQLLTGNAPVPAVLPLLSDALGRIGVQLTALSVDLPTLFGRLAAGDFDLGLSLYPGPGGVSPEADPDLLRSFYSSLVLGRLQGAQGYVDAQLDQLAQEQLVAVDDSRRRRLVGELQRIVARDVPVLPLYYPTLYTVFRKDVFDAWYFTPGGFAGGLPGVHNKHVLITGRTAGVGPPSS
jgi:peptide/nickel transport system substrate-binding protein